MLCSQFTVQYNQCMSTLHTLYVHVLYFICTNYIHIACLLLTCLYKFLEFSTNAMISIVHASKMLLFWFSACLIIPIIIALYTHNRFSWFFCFFVVSLVWIAIVSFFFYPKITSSLAIWSKTQPWTWTCTNMNMCKLQTHTFSHASLRPIHSSWSLCREGIFNFELKCSM